MNCTTVKEGTDCFFMNKAGCQFNGGICHQVVEECEGCRKIQEFSTGKFCLCFPDPSSKWRMGICNMATHKSTLTTKERNKVNPLKASKRMAH